MRARTVDVPSVNTSAKSTRVVSEICEVEFIQPHGVWLLLEVSVNLVIHGDSIPTGSGTVIARDVDVVGHAVQRNRLEYQFVGGGSLHLDHEVIPGVAYWIAGDTGRDPVLIHVIPGVPRVTASNAALMAPYKPVATEELVDVKFQRLRGLHIVHEEVDIIGEVVQGGDKGVTAVRKSL